MPEQTAAPAATTETAAAPAADECVLCDRVLAVAGLAIGAVVTVMALDLLAGGRLSGLLGLGRARRPAEGDGTEAGQ